MMDSNRKQRHGNGTGRLRRQRSQEWREREYSSSDEDQVRPSKSSSGLGYRSNTSETGQSVLAMLNSYQDYNESPPEPAPPEINGRGMSMHHMIGARTPGRRVPAYSDVEPDEDGYTTPRSNNTVFISQDFLMSGTGRQYNKGGISPGVKENGQSLKDECSRLHGSNLNSQMGRPTPPSSSVTHTTSGGSPGSGPSSGGCPPQLSNSGLSGPIPSLGPTLTTLPTHILPSYSGRSTLPIYNGPGVEPTYKSPPFHFDKFRRQCSWKWIAIILLIFCIILIGVIAYLAALASYLGSEQQSCIVVEDAQGLAAAGSSQVESNSNVQSDDKTEVTSPMTKVTSTPDLLTPTVARSWDRWPAIVVTEQNKWYDSVIQSLGFWNVELMMPTSTHMWLNLSVPRTSNLALFGRRNVAPSVTEYDFVEFIKSGQPQGRHKRDVDGPQPRSPYQQGWRFDYLPISFKMNFVDPPKQLVLDQSDQRREKRSNQNVNVSTIQYLDTGRWYLSVFNDELDEVVVAMVMGPAEVTTSCPHDCNGHGTCFLGRCDCETGYDGNDCSKSICPILCSNHGEYLGGVCHCEEGWKGSECDVPDHDCEVADCSGHGKCISGICYCDAGWKGLHCHIEDCPHPTCSGHGFCVDKKCVCKAGWKGENCSVTDEHVNRCLPDCSGHGSYDIERGMCVCEQQWSGSDCSEVLCSLDCGPHGQCDKGVCKCHNGWEGERCELQSCDDRCSNHGQCKNGTCVCMQGWNGKHCTIVGCENTCSNHGRCQLENEHSVYQCMCDPGWDGKDCSIPLEKNCNDEVDNDGDGLVDCSDSECCSQAVCKEHIMCLASNDPVEVLLRKQPPTVTASFYQRVKFLIEEKSVQSYARKDEYSESQFWSAFIPRRVSVVRGRVVTSQGLGIIGIRVSVDRDPKFGFTLTRQGGWFDMLVNGGGALTLQFQRSPFQPRIKTVLVPWNQIVVLDPVVMSLEKEDFMRPELAENVPSFSPCLVHDYELMKPIVYSSYMPKLMGGYSSRSLVFSESQVLQESLPIPGSGIRLVYHSSQAPGYLATLHMHLTGSSIPRDLKQAHLVLIIEGSVVNKIFEADPNITYTFVWNKRNVYKQKVYGPTLAKVSIGYEYSGCQNIIWESQTVTLQGFDMDVSDIGGWNLEIHHRYNFHEGILQKGDGSIVNFKEYPRIVKPVVGNGIRRPLVCESCNGNPINSSLLTLVTLATGPDGSLYIGDFNLVRRIPPEGEIYTVLQLSTTQVSNKYHLATSPADGALYLSDPEKHQILRVINLDVVDDPKENFQVVVGSGERCIPGDENKCGDGGPGRNAKLAHPKGLAISVDHSIYIADGTNIRYVDPKGIIHTLVGHYEHYQQWKLLPCHGALPFNQVQLQWPTNLAISPLDNNVYFVDDHLILKLTSDSKVKVVAGKPLQCQNPGGTPKKKDSTHVIASIRSMAFDTRGDLYISEVTSKGVDVIRKITPSGEISDFAGHFNPCHCQNSSCTCDSEDSKLSTSRQFRGIPTLVFSPDNTLFVGDQFSRQVLALESYLPERDKNGDFHIPYPARSEIYMFNKYGQHIATRDLLSGRFIYSFLYNVNTSFGKLSKVTDSSGNKLSFLRDYKKEVTTIENTQGQKCKIKVSRLGLMEKLMVSKHLEITLEYKEETGLLTSRTDTAGDSHLYDYSEEGRIRTFVAPTGERTTLKSELSPDGKFLVTVIKDGEVRYSSKINPITNQIVYFEDDLQTEVVFGNNGSYSIKTNKGTYLEGLSTGSDNLLKPVMPMEAEMLRLPTLQRFSLGGNLVGEMEWKMYYDEEPGSEDKFLLRELWSNGSRILSSKYRHVASREMLFGHDQEPLLSVEYGPYGFPIHWRPAGNGASLNLSYDRFGRLTTLAWGEIIERFTYNRQGLLAGIRHSDGGVEKFSYSVGDMPSEVSLPSGRTYFFHYDRLGDLKHITTPRGGRHTFDLEPLFGFFKVSYTKPGHRRPYIQYYSPENRLLETRFPEGSGKILYRYDAKGQLNEIVHGEGLVKFTYALGVLKSISHKEPEFEYKIDYDTSGNIVMEERVDYGQRTGLSSAKFSFTYDNNFRMTSVQGRIGGQSLAQYRQEFDIFTGQLTEISQFRVSRAKMNSTTVYDGTTTFLRFFDNHFRLNKMTVSIQGVEVFVMDLIYDSRNRVSKLRTSTPNRVNSYMNVKNFTYDTDGQLVEVQSQEPWSFTYDDNGNMQSLTYQGNTIPMEYDIMDRIVKFGEGKYQYNERGYVLQNAKEEKFRYNSHGLLVQAFKQNRFDIRYFYDYHNRLIARKDNYGNVTQYFYTNYERPHQLTYIYSPRDGKLMSLVYDDIGHLMFAQMFKKRYYIVTDPCGTPIIIFNEYGEVIREMSRSPYGHILYDTKPYLYLPVDFCGGILDQVTNLVHMPNGKIYDSLVGMYMTPSWEDILKRTTNLVHFHLYRFNGNDPINTHQTLTPPTDHFGWLNLLGYNMDRIMFPISKSSPIPRAPQTLTSLNSQLNDLIQSDFSCSIQPRPFVTVSGAISLLFQNKVNLEVIPTIAVSAMTQEQLFSSMTPKLSRSPFPLGDGLVVSVVDGQAVISSIPSANNIYRDVFTSVLNQSYMLDFHFPMHNHDTFYFVKETTKKVHEDLSQLHRLGNLVNSSRIVHKSKNGEEMVDIKIRFPTILVNVRYGTTVKEEKLRLQKHAKQQISRKAWDREKELLLSGFPGTVKWSKQDVEEIMRIGSCPDYEEFYRQNITLYPSLADDFYNLEFRKRNGRRTRRRREMKRVTHFFEHVCKRPKWRDIAKSVCGDYS